jgi:hypothetical protein
MGIMTIISAFILVLVIIYATNTKKINALFGWDQKKKVAVETEVTEEEQPATDTVFHGDQIGDSLTAFLMDDDFFDETEKVPSAVVVRKTDVVADDAAAGTESSFTEEEEEKGGTGMAIVGQLTNPSLEGAADSSGYLTSLPDPPPGGYGEYIPSDQTITGTPVGTP